MSLTYTGVGNPFTLGTNVLFNIDNIQLLAPGGNIFSFEGAAALDVSNTVILACVDLGDFTAAASSARVIVNVTISSSTGQGVISHGL